LLYDLYHGVNATAVHELKDEVDDALLIVSSIELYLYMLAS
jgi:hypothetical protein